MYHRLIPKDYDNCFEKAFNGPGSMPITKQLLQLGRSVHAHYAMCLEKEWKEKEKAQKQLTLQKEQALQMEAQNQQLSGEKKGERVRKE